jgi:hypothetical protein
MRHNQETPMSRYYFDTTDADTVIQDQQGMDLDSLEAARIEAVNRLPDFTQGIPADNEKRETIVEVRDASGVPLFKAMSSLVIVPFATHSHS